MIIVIVKNAWRWIGWVLGAGLVGLCLWTAYTNVFADDAAVRARAEKLARDQAGCGEKCKPLRTEGRRGVINETITYTFATEGTVTVTCRRPYIAFGEHVCRASKP